MEMASSAMQPPQLDTVQWPSWNSLLFPRPLDRACHVPGATYVPGCERGLPPLYLNSNTLTGEEGRAEFISETGVAL